MQLLNGDAPFKARITDVAIKKMLHIAALNYNYMTSIKAYKILTYILFPFAALFTLNALNGLFAGITNPPLLVVSFIVACMPIYTYTSSKFLFSGILKAQTCSPKLKDWIKANAIVSICFAAFLLLAGLGAMVILQQPQAFLQAIQQMPAEQKDLMGALNPQQLEQFLKVAIFLLLAISILLIYHIILTFKFLKIYHHVFHKE